MSDDAAAPRARTRRPLLWLGVLALIATLAVREVRRPSGVPARSLTRRTAGGSPPPLQQTLQPIDRNVLIQRSLDIFSAGYLSNISIIQGVALSVLVTQAVGLGFKDQPSPWVRVEVLLKATFVLIALIVVSYEYLWFTTIMRWVPTFRDTVVPLTLS